jgi:hypothetical protein
MVLLTWNRTASKCVSSNNFDYWFWQFSCFAHNFAERFVANQRFCGHLHSWQVPFFPAVLLKISVDVKYFIPIVKVLMGFFVVQSCLVLNV